MSEKNSSALEKFRSMISARSHGFQDLDRTVEGYHKAILDILDIDETVDGDKMLTKSGNFTIRGASKVLDRIKEISEEK